MLEDRPGARRTQLSRFRRNRGGEIISLDVLDGATIKVLIDDTGRRPQPPARAYEQVIHGVRGGS